MRRWLNAIILIILALYFPSCAQTKTERNSEHGPRLKFDVEEFNFGEVDEGMLVRHIFKFKNTGDDTLRITRVDPG